MSMHDDKVCLKDMLCHASEAVELLGNMNKEALGLDRVMQLALTRLVEIVGEAANRVSIVTRKRTPRIPWSEIIGMRNRLVHGYDVIDLDLLWDTVTSDLPPLIATLQKSMKEM
jgi:uncharacterized protein with HEPN domain